MNKAININYKISYIYKSHLKSLGGMKTCQDNCMRTNIVVKTRHRTKFEHSQKYEHRKCNFFLYSLYRELRSTFCTLKFSPLREISLRSLYPLVMGQDRIGWLVAKLTLTGTY